MQLTPLPPTVLPKVYPFVRMASVLSATPEPDGDGMFLKHHHIAPWQAAASRQLAQQGCGEWVDGYTEPGTYVHLVEKREGQYRVWMSDQWAERYTNGSFCYQARGDVLILGLGIGMLPVSLLRRRRKTVRSVTVIERSPDVIALVGSAIQQPKLTILQADAFTPPFGTQARFDSIFIDIWPTISLAFYQEMQDLLRQYRSFLRPNGIIRAWMDSYLEASYVAGRLLPSPIVD